MTARKTALLLILDGWGHREATDSNAISAANSPTWDTLWRDKPNTLVRTSGLAVGLPEGQMGNSEVGHMNLGAGRVVYQNLTRIDKDIADGSFVHNPVLTRAVDTSIERNSALHVFGLLSPGGIHSHEDQIVSMLELALARGANQVFFHAFLDGRDTPPRSALASLLRVETLLTQSGCGRIASLCGRFFSMDRDNRWERVEPAYDLLTRGEAEFTFANVETALAAAYSRGEDDEFVKPTVVGETAAAVKDDDVVVFMNFRSDRARELTRAFVERDFDGFSRKTIPSLASFVTLTHYADDIVTPCAYPPEALVNVLGETLAAQGKTQLRIAETEKYAHVTFFFNGGREEPFSCEDRKLIPSPDVKTYDLKPEMSAFEVTDNLVDAILSRQYDAIICNYANGDMVGHTGDFNAAVKAVEALDLCLARIVAAIEEADGELLITADHGNVEQMLDAETQQPLTSHTNGPVPLVYVGSSGKRFSGEGSLCDLAPTLLSLLDLTIPAEMTGRDLLA
ncbi:MAG: 2,3-bisphosphoglycerate-independent phosphoglycerate mutase [Proteobacteria bacterium]|nr:2,3-bisphosphoglycerate-independent phosphoglycerate mutase [Pseudomonadota bacterium]MDA0896990.1 2,3-bisphosphoglycerate-independent phosphoglycerate mutase [Pseudomonadota bacterium]MDA1245100.1 2,3-bisphosphoglycerate-independent phosphoglycerate mutase [Pseudomonadota bacterium]